MTDDLILFTEDTDSLSTLPKPSILPWKVLVVDDDAEVHEVTRFVLRGVHLLERPLLLLHAYSGTQARECFREHPDIAVALLDVVMETDQAGLDLVGYIRTELGLAECRIILRTGQPGYAPELTVIREYDINDYRTKAELTHTRLITMIGTALRTYQQLHAMAEHQRGLEWVIRTTADLMERHSIADLVEGVLTKLATLFEPPPENMVCVQQDAPIGDDSGYSRYVVAGATGQHTRHIGQLLDNLPNSWIVAAIRNCIALRQPLFGTDCTVLTLNVVPHQNIIIFIDSGRVPDVFKSPLLDTLMTNIVACLRNVKLIEFKRREQALLDRQTLLVETVQQRTQELDEVNKALLERNAQFQAFMDNAPFEMALKDANGRYLLVNRYCELLYSRSNEEFKGKLPQEVHRSAIPAAEKLHANDMAVIKAGITRTTEINEAREDQTHTFLATSFPIFGSQRQVSGLGVIGLEITERKLLEERLKSSLHEKEVLLKEIHHRVKNNLQVISSLLDLQAENISDPVVNDQFQQSRNRVRSMALIHELLYQSPNLARIDFAEYVHGLVTYLLQFYDETECEIATQVEVTTADQTLSVEVAVPCGLIINELVINAMKHAFVARRMGQISIVLQAAQGHLVLRVKDNGVGFPDTVDFRRTSSLGMTIVTSLVAQLKGDIKLHSQEGTEFIITFPNQDKKQPIV